MRKSTVFAAVALAVAFGATSARAEERGHELLRGRLARAAGDADHLRAQRMAVLGGDARELLASIDDPRRAGRAGLRDEVVAVHALALHRDEQHARLHLPRIERRAVERRHQQTPRVELR